MTLIERIKNTSKKFLGAVALSSMLVPVGCGIGSYSKDPRAGFVVNETLGFLGDVFVAETGKDHVEQNVFVNEEQKRKKEALRKELEEIREELTKIKQNPHYRLSTPFGDLVIASYNYCKDFDGDRRISFPQEHMGVKERFSPGERIQVSLMSMNSLFKELKYELFDERGEVIDTVTFSNTYGMFGTYNVSEQEIDSLLAVNKNMIRGKLDALGVGNYKAVWYSEGKFVAMWDFSVAPEVAQK